MTRSDLRRQPLALLIAAALGAALVAGACWQAPAFASTHEGLQGMVLAQQQYDEGHFDVAATHLEDAMLKNTLTGEDLLRARELLGRSYCRVGKTERGQSMFRLLLEARPDWRLDPVYCPPVETQAFEQVRRTLEADTGDTGRGFEQGASASVAMSPPPSAQRGSWQGGTSRSPMGSGLGGLKGTIGVNPVGLAMDGLSFLEYTKPIAGNTSLTFRLDYVHWTDNEDENEGYTDVWRTKYDEKGTGFGAGIGVRSAFGNPLGASFVIGGGLDFVSASWEWTQQSWDIYGYPSYHDSGDGTTTAVAYHGGLGGRFVFGDSGFFLEPQLLFGSMSLEVDSSQGYGSGIGFFVGPAVTFGMTLR